ncbi:threonylcarbamoyl-AMP synthase [bacterium]|nr:threonylcarbamoyl-AMP synthase [bacterium]
MNRKTKSPFPPLRALIFDMDGTLYRSSELNRRYDESMVRFLSRERNLTYSEAKYLFEKTYCMLIRKLGRMPSKLFTLTQLGACDRKWARLHGAKVLPGEILKFDPRLRRVLHKLRESFQLAIVTNNHAKNMHATLGALGIDDCFDYVASLTDSGIYKPSSKLYAIAAKAMSVDYAFCLSIGDRFDLDLAPAADIGMHTLLVDKMENIYQLSEILHNATAEKISIKHPKLAGPAINQAAAQLKKGRLVVIPTDTVYGLAAVPERTAVERIFRAKGRSKNSPIPILLSHHRQAEKIAKVSKTAKKLMQLHWPGGLTIVLPVKKGSKMGVLAGGGRTVALRVPDHWVARQVIAKAGGALAVTSANRSGEPAPVVARHIHKKIVAFSTVLLDAGMCKQKKHSTIVRVSNRKVVILRQGSIVL